MGAPDFAARDEQRAWNEQAKLDKRDLFLRRLRAEPTLTYAQIKERLGIGHDQAKQWAKEAGLTIGKPDDHGHPERPRGDQHHPPAGKKTLMADLDLRPLVEASRALVREYDAVKARLIKGETLRLVADPGTHDGAPGRSWTCSGSR